VEVKIGVKSMVVREWGSMGVWEYGSESGDFFTLFRLQN